MTRFQFITTLAVMGIMSVAGSFLAVSIMQGDGPLHAQEDGVVEAQEFRLRDSNGKLRALMSVKESQGDGKDGGMIFTMLDENEKVRMTLNVEDDGSAGIVVSAPDGTPRMGLTSSDAEPGQFSVFDSKGEPAAMLAIGKEDFPMMTLRHTKGEAILGINPDGTSVISLAGGEGDKKAAFFSATGGPGVPSSIMLDNSTSGANVMLSATDAGQMLLSMRQEKGETKEEYLTVMAGGDTPSLFSIANPKANSSLSMTALNDGTMQFGMEYNDALTASLTAGGGGTASLELEHAEGGSKVYVQAQKSGKSILQLGGGKSYLRAMRNEDGSGEWAIIKDGNYDWRETGKK